MHIRNRIFTRLGLLATLVLALPALSNDATAAYKTGAIGGNGGGDWSSPCRPNDVLVGVHVSYGNALDAITAICSPLNAARTDWAGEKYQPTQLWGGRGGRPKELNCKRGYAVHRLKIDMGPWDAVDVVKGIGLVCGGLNAADYYGRTLAAQSTVTNGGELKCKDGDWATGLYGKSGVLIDQAGLICDRIAPDAGGIQAEGAPGMNNVDLPGNDIRNLMSRNEGTCRQACAAAEGCVAWTFVRNGSMCWLKNAVPAAVASGCCVSGVMAAADIAAAPKPVRSMKKMRKVRVDQSVDVCSTSEGCDENTRIAVLEAETENVFLVGSCADNFCHVKWPDGEGWVYDGPGHDSLTY